MLKCKAVRDGDIVNVTARETENEQAITLRLTLNDAKLLSMMLHIAVEGSEEVQDEVEDTLRLAP